MAQVVGDNSNVYNETICNDFFPDIAVIDFQNDFNYQQNADRNHLLSTLQSAYDSFYYQIKKTTSNFISYADFCEKHHLSTDAIFRIVKRAVFHLAMSDILADKITTSDEKDGEKRRSNLQEKQQHHDASARNQIAMLEFDTQLSVGVV
jgi:hypothetical protein